MSAILWGMLSAGSPTPTTLNLLDTDIGKRPSLVIFFTDWHDGGMWPAGAYNSVGAGSTLRTNLDAVYARGQIPMIDWYSDQASDPNFSLKAIYAQNRHDAFLIQFAQDIAAWGKPVMIRMDPEMNGTWHPGYCDLSTTFGLPGEKNAAGDFALMWKHVVDIFIAQGAVNVSWVFCPNFQPPPVVPLTYASLLPTPIKKYVQWLGFDIYNWGGSQPGGGKTQPWFTFEACMRGTGLAAGWLGDTWAETIALDPDLPIMLGEVGCDTREGTDTNAGAGVTAVWNGGKKAAWFVDTFGTQVPGKGATDYSRIGAVCYFNTTDGGAAPPIAGGFTIGNGDWPIEDPTVASGKAGGGLPLAAIQGVNGPGGSGFYVAGNQILLPAGMRTIPRYEGFAQVNRFTQAIQHTSPGHITGWWKLSEPSGTTLADFSGGGHSLSLTGSAGTQYILGSQKLIPGTIADLSILFDGAVGFASAPSQPGWSVPTTGKLTVMLAFRMVSLGAGPGCLVGKANSAGTGYEWHIHSTNTGGLAWENFKADGSNYSSAGQNSGLITTGVTYLVFGAIDQARTPNVGRIGVGTLGGSMVFFDSADTLVNAPTAGNGTLDIGRRGDNAQYANAYESELVIWNTMLPDVSMIELFTAFNHRRPNSRI